MRRLLFAAGLLLILTAPARAASLFIRPSTSADHTGSTVTTLAITMPTQLVGDELGILTAAFYGGSSAPTSIAITGSSWTLVNSTTCGVVVQAVYKRNMTSGDAGSTQTFNWTNAAGVELAFDSFVGTDGAVPVVHAAATPSCNTSATSLIAPTITPVQSGDFVYLIGDHGASGAPIGSWSGTPQANNLHILSVDYFGWSNAGVAPSMPTYSSGGSAAPIVTEALDIEASTAGSAVISAGVETAASGSSVTPTIPTFSNNGDALIATIAQASTAVITPPSDIQFRVASTAVNPGNVTSCTVQIPAGVVVGDQMIAMINNQDKTSTVTGPSTGNPWTQVGSDTNFFAYTAWKKTVESGDASANRTWTFSHSAFSGCGIVDYYSYTAQTISVDASTFSHAAAATTFSPSSVATTGANRVIVMSGLENANNTLSVASPVHVALNATGQNWIIGDYPQAASGASITPQISGGNAGASGWAGFQIALTSGGVAGPWTKIGSSVIDPSNGVELDSFSHIQTSGDPTWQWNFASAPTTGYGLITAFGNLNTTTPVDANNSVALTGLDNPVYSQVSPTTSDELLFNVFVTSGSITGAPITQYPKEPILAGARIFAAYSPISGAGVSQFNPNATNANAFAAMSMGLKAVTTPTRTTANARINQAALILFTTVAAPAASAASNFELIY
jgi:hypothetical protein